MIEFSIELDLLSPALPGSGTGFGSGIDSDVVFDELGLPVIPAKRIKGCLRDAVSEAYEMLEVAGISKDKFHLEKTFGEVGAGIPEDTLKIDETLKKKRNTKGAGKVYFSNFFLTDYEQTCGWLRYFVKSDDYKPLVTPERILETFTEVRQQTKIGDNGVAFDHSLRTIRVLRKGLKFLGKVHIDKDDAEITNVLLLACQNFRHFGTRRNRGFGEVRCTLMDRNNQPLFIDEKLEALCTA